MGTPNAGSSQLVSSKSLEWFGREEKGKGGTSGEKRRVKTVGNSSK